MNRALIAAAGAAAGAGLAAAYVVAGPEGLVALGIVLASAALLAARAAITPPASRRPAARRPASPAVRAADFPAYRKIESNLGWAGGSQRHYDHITRPMLSRLLGAALEERHRLDISGHPEEARRLVGADLWSLIDPSAPQSDDSNAPGPDRAVLSRVVDRLEQL